MTDPGPHLYLPAPMAAALQEAVNWAFEEGTFGHAFASFARLNAKEVRRTHGGLAVIATALEEAAQVQVSDLPERIKRRVVFDLRCSVKAVAACITGSAVPRSVIEARAPRVVQVDFKRRAAGERDDDDGEPVGTGTIMDTGDDPTGEPGDD